MKTIKFIGLFLAFGLMFTSVNAQYKQVASSINNQQLSSITSESITNFGSLNLLATNSLPLQSTLFQSTTKLKNVTEYEGQRNIYEMV